MLELERAPSETRRISKNYSNRTSSQRQPQAPEMERLAADLVGLFKLLADDTRLRILLALMQDKEMHVRALCELLGQSQPAVSHHLALMRVAGLIERRREGKHNFYHLVPGRFQQLLDIVFASFDPVDRQLRFKDYVLSRTPE